MTNSSHLDAMMEEAIAQQRAGRNDDAAHLYRAVLDQQEDNAVANHNLGVLMAQRGEVLRSLTHFKAALESEPEEGLFWLSYARGLLVAGRPEDAARVLHSARRHGFVDPGLDGLVSQALDQQTPMDLDVRDLYSAAVQHQKSGRTSEAVALFRRVISSQPDHLAAYENLAAALVVLNRFDEAIEVYRRALEVAPPTAELLESLGSALAERGAYDEAIQAYRQAIALKPDMAEAHFHLGSVLSENAQIAEGFEHYMRRAELVYGAAQGERTASRSKDPPHKVKHDREQREYLEGTAGAGGSRGFRIEDGTRVDGPAVNLRNATPQLHAQWRESSPQMVVIDDFLTAPALDKLRRYCAGSTIWRRTYDAGYIGATPEDGLACPLLAQIAEEIQDTYVDILGPHRFRYLGAFKYDSELSTGTNTHADNSAVNVNFYITPDDANLEPWSGGMQIWDVGAPDAVAMRRYNGDEDAVREFLVRSGARMTIVPHRANRAVIFRSSLFHKTDHFRFKAGYLNKRINVSLLFGNLGDPT